MDRWVWGQRQVLIEKKTPEVNLQLLLFSANKYGPGWMDGWMNGWMDGWVVEPG